ncbi:hypothetical protein Scel_10140 [Streptomyces cellostaticus]|nr:hypothetical protein Scel_10140 [Streptomyces cellostaticus]
MTAPTPPRRPPLRGGGSGFARLSKKITEAGLMNRRPGYYTVWSVAVAVAYTGGWSACVVIGAGWWTLPVAACLAVMFGQVALLAHDVAQRQVFRRRRPSEMSGRIAGPRSGLGYGWWQD